MKVTLVDLPYSKRSTPSLEIAYLASKLIKEGYTVPRFEFNLKFINKKWINYIKKINRTFYSNVSGILLDFKNNKFSKLNKYIRYCGLTVLKSKPDVVEFTFNTFNWTLTLLVARFIKRMNRNIIVIFDATNTLLVDNQTKSYLKNGWVDYIIWLDGDQKVPELLKKIKDSENINIPGILYLKGGRVIYTGEPKPIKNIDDFEFPLFRREDIENSRYTNLLPITTSRGCAGSCSFCAFSKNFKGIRMRSPENVLTELKYQIKKFGIKNFKFNDAMINSNHESLKKLCKLIIREDISINWGVSVKANKKLNNHLLNLMYKAGCRYLFFGAESGSNKVLKHMNKQITTQILEQNIRDAYKNNIWVHLYFIVGYPTETKDDFLKTIQFIIKNRKYISSLEFKSFFLNPIADVYTKYKIKSINTAIAKKRLKYVEQIFGHDSTISFTKREYTRNFFDVKRTKYTRGIEINRDNYNKTLKKYKITSRLESKNEKYKRLSSLDYLSVSQTNKKSGISERAKHILITGKCNSRCLFCFSREELVREHFPIRILKNIMQEGIDAGCELLVLSGGEPTIHPDFIEIIKLSKSLGYKNVRVITNGRMFSYRKFLKESMEAGLDEATISIHSHIPEIQDALVGVKGSFMQTLRGIKNCISLGLEVKINIVVNSMNIKNLKDTVSFFYGVGLRRIGLLRLMPFGRAWGNKDLLFYDHLKNKRYLDSALKFSRERGIDIWTNRFDLELFKEYPEYMQDPFKFINEVEARIDEFENLTRGDIKMFCYPERCGYCFLGKFCKELNETNKRVKSLSHDKKIIEKYKNCLDKDGNINPMRFAEYYIKRFKYEKIRP